MVRRRTSIDGSRIDNLKDLAVHLRTSVRPLNTFLEAKRDVGSVAAIRKTAESHIQALLAKAGTSPAPVPPGSRRSRTRVKVIPLAEEIPKYFSDSVFDTGATKPFAPAGTIEQLVVRDTVRAALAIHKDDDGEDNLVDFITNKAYKLFAIVVHVGFVPDYIFYAMEMFMENDIDDNNLPIIHVESELERARKRSQGDENLSSQRESVLTSIDPEEEVWSFARRIEFYSKQWKFLVPVFSTEEDNIELFPSTILPFTYKGDETKSGGFGEVFKVGIDVRHIEDPKDTVKFIFCGFTADY
jgi:hypothetical protein